MLLLSGSWGEEEEEDLVRPGRRTLETPGDLRDQEEEEDSGGPYLQMVEAPQT